MILRITSKEGRLNASFTEMEKPDDFLDEPEEIYRWVTSFQPIQLSEDAECYLGYILWNKNINTLELSEKETEYCEAVQIFHTASVTPNPHYTYELRMKEQSITPESEILKSLEGVRVDKLENVFTPQPTDDVDWDEVFDFYVKESEQVPERSLAVNLFHFLKSKFKITRR